jgi:PTS system galactitol-specific IIA component
MTLENVPPNNNHTLINEELILTELDCLTSEEVINTLSERLYHAGYVKQGFAEAVIDREREFPTGLPCEIPVAIPHCDPTHCNHSAISLGLLKNPVTFGEMGDNNHYVLVDIVFLLAINNPDQQVIWLRRLTDFFQQANLMRDLQNTTSNLEAAELLRKHLLAHS